MLKQGLPVHGGVETRSAKIGVKEETQATIRCIPMEQPGGEGECIVCGTQAKEITIFSRAY